jgi:hypothetical protein
MKYSHIYTLFLNRSVDCFDSTGNQSPYFKKIMVEKYYYKLFVSYSFLIYPLIRLD